MTEKLAASYVGPDDQADVLAFLESRAAFPVAGPPRRIDTHAASVFLADDRAWKLKRAVRFDYLDFSTPAKRHEALETELRLNRRTAPDLYLSIQPIVRTPSGEFRIGGGGESIDWLLEMRRFPDGALLSEMADAGTLSDEILLALADAIAAFHGSATVAPNAAAAERFAKVIEGNAAALEHYPGIFDEVTCSILLGRQRSLFDKHRDLLDHRGSLGCVVHGHGDLHLANIALMDGKPLPFDCLEFSCELATVDRLYDLSFLLMDLWNRGLRRETALVANRYLDLEAEDEVGLILLPLFMSVRATIRAHVAAALANRGSKPAREQATRYLKLAARLLDPEAPRLLAVGGLSGTGKSSVARALCGFGSPPGARVLRSDVLRKRLAGVPPEARLDPAHYTPEASEAVYQELAALASATLRGGHSVVADAVFVEPREREAIRATAVAAGASFAGVWLEAPRAVRIERVGSRIRDASDADAKVADRQEAYFVGDLEDWQRCDASRPLTEVAADARRICKLSA